MEAYAVIESAGDGFWTVDVRGEESGQPVTYASYWTEGPDSIEAALDALARGGWRLVSDWRPGPVPGQRIADVDPAR